MIRLIGKGRMFSSTLCTCNGADDAGATDVSGLSAISETTENGRHFERLTRLDVMGQDWCRSRPDGITEKRLRPGLDANTRWRDGPPGVEEQRQPLLATVEITLGRAVAPSLVSSGLSVALTLSADKVLAPSFRLDASAPRDRCLFPRVTDTVPAPDGGCLHATSFVADRTET